MKTIAIVAADTVEEFRYRRLALYLGRTFLLWFIACTFENEICITLKNVP